MRRLLRTSLFALLIQCGPVPATDAGMDVPDVPWAHPDATIDTFGDPRLHVYVRDAINGEGLPCKLTVRGVGGTATPDWGNADMAHGEWLDRDNWALGMGRWVLMARGRAVLTLPPGSYSLTVTRGTEYAALDLGTVDIGAEQGAVAAGALRRVVNTEGMIAGEFHVHTNPSSDCGVPIDERVLSLAVEGIEVFASTDHNALGDFQPAIDILGLRRFIHWIKGDEISPSDGQGLGHFGAFPLPDGFDPVTQPLIDTTVMGIVQRARQVMRGGVLQLNHPLWRDHSIGYWSLAGFDPMTGTSAMELVRDFDAVEVYNSHTLDETDRGFVSVDAVIDTWMATLQLGHRSTAMGNSDSHRLSHSPPGWPRSYLRVASDDPAAVTDAMVTSAILAGDAVVSSGPMISARIGDVRPGGTARAISGRVMIHVEMQTAEFAPVESIQVIANRTVVSTQPVTAAVIDGVRRQTWDLPVDLTRDAWIVVRTLASDGLPDLAGIHARPLPSLAMANPIYVDTDGDGTWTPPGRVDAGP